MADETLEVLRSIDLKLSAVVALLADQRLRATDAGKQRPRSVDRILIDQGMSGAQVGRVLGKSKQAVHQAVAREGGKGPTRASSRTAANGAGGEKVTVGLAG